AVRPRLDSQIRLRQDLRMRTNLTDDHKIITLWPAESISRGDRSRLPFRRIWQSTRPSFSPLLSTPAFPDTSENIFEGDLLCRSVRAHSGSARQETRPACCSPQPVGSCLRDAQTQGTLPGVRR